MEKMPYTAATDTVVSTVALGDATASADWRTGLPTLTGALVTLRELRHTDAAALLASLSTQEVSRFISPPPTTVAGFERFIAWTHRQRAAGQYVCFAVVPHHRDTAVGLFQVRSLEPGFGAAEWGFALAVELWGTGVFMDGARLTLDFAFSAIGTRRVEARAAVQNGRGNAALRKLGAVHEGVLRKSLHLRGRYLDQSLWAILQDEWFEFRPVYRVRVIH